MSSIPDQELDYQYHYSPSRWSHRMGPDEVVQSHIKVVTEVTREAQWCMDAETDIAYGDTPRQKLDVYTQKNSAGHKGSPIFVYIHGGYWQIKEIGHETSGFMAQTLAAAGATVIPIGYELCPDGDTAETSVGDTLDPQTTDFSDVVEIGVSMDEIIAEVKQALYFIFKLAKERHSSGIYLCGHSAGAHLACMMLMTSFQDDDAFDSELIKGAVLVSGVYDLRPLVKTSINDALRLTEEDAWKLSPANFVNDVCHHSKQRDIIVVVGEYDPPEFRRQSGEFEKSLRDHGAQARYLDIPDTDHFDVVEKMRQSNYSLTKECIRLMKLDSK